MRFRRLVVTLAVVAALAGCRGATSIKTLLDDPSQYDRKTVTVAGTVGRSIGALGFGAYELSDDSGMIAVVSRSGGAPREGAKVVVRGEFRNAYTLGTRTGAAILEEDRTTR